MTEGQAVTCARPGCSYPYSEHAPGGGACSNPDCDCEGFLWVDPEGVPVGSYQEPPARPMI